METHEAQRFIRDAVAATARTRIPAKARAVEAVLLDDRQTGIRAAARSERLAESTLRALIGRVKAAGRRRFRN